MTSMDLSITVIACTAIICYTAYKIARLRYERSNHE
jgi:hypothetical protein